MSAACSTRGVKSGLRVIRVRVAVTPYRNPLDDIPRDLAWPAVVEPRGTRVRGPANAARLLFQSVRYTEEVNKYCGTFP